MKKKAAVAKGKKRVAKKPGAARPAAAPKTAPGAERRPGVMRHWLVKSEPEVFSFDDLVNASGRTTGWDGVRNFAARNHLRDGMKLGDLVFFYHSNADPPAIVGICEVVREAYPDASALDRKHANFDPGASAANPRWYMVDVRALKKLGRAVSLAELKARKDLAGMALLRIGRLSVSPVTQQEWNIVLEMAGQGAQS